jgi:Domain of unknown function (DUF4156)
VQRISKMPARRIAVLCAALALPAGACAWVKLTDAGSQVRMATPAEVASCDKLGATHAKTSPDAWIFSRNPRKIDQEVEFLARNEAADMGGDTIVPRSPTSDEGRRSFDVYVCQ